MELNVENLKLRFQKYFPSTQHLLEATTKKEEKIIYASKLVKPDDNFLPEVKSKDLENLVKNNFYDKSVMETGKLVVDAVLSLKHGSDMNEQQKLNVWIGNLKQIGTSSTNGHALLGNFNSGNPNDSPGKNFIVIKAPQHSSKANSEEIIHEVFIGIRVGNSMRILGIPNFSYVFGFFSGSRPLINNEKEVVQWGREKDKVSYAVYENIPNVGNMREFVKKCSSEQFVSCYSQILVSLLMARKLFGFTHYDLHNENVLMREFSPCYIKYEIPGGKTYYVYCNGYIPTIIDYGSSYMRYKGENHPNHNKDHESLGSLKDQDNFFYDAFKLLGFCMKGAILRRNYELVNSLKEIYSYFFREGEDSNKVFDFLSTRWFCLPKEFTEGRGLNPEGFIFYISELFPDLILEDPDVEPKNLFPLTRERHTVNSVLKASGVKDMIAEPITFAEYYEVSTALKNNYPYSSGRARDFITATFRNLNNKFDYKYAIEIQQGIFRHLLTECNKIDKEKDTLVIDIPSYLVNVGSDGKHYYTKEGLNFIENSYKMAKYIGLVLKLRDQICFTCYCVKVFGDLGELTHPRELDELEEFESRQAAVQSKCVCDVYELDRCLCDIPKDFIDMKNIVSRVNGNAKKYAEKMNENLVKIEAMGDPFKELYHKLNSISYS